MDDLSWIPNPEVIPFYQQMDHVVTSVSVIKSLETMTTAFQESVINFEREVQNFTMLAKTAVTDNLQSVKAMFESNTLSLTCAEVVQAYIVWIDYISRKLI